MLFFHALPSPRVFWVPALGMLDWDYHFISDTLAVSPEKQKIGLTFLSLYPKCLTYPRCSVKIGGQKERKEKGTREGERKGRMEGQNRNIGVLEGSQS